MSAENETPNAVPAPEGKYVYCIIESPEPRSFGPIGIGGRGDEVYTVHHDGLAAVVSNTPIQVYDPTRENVFAHEQVNETVMRERVIGELEEQSVEIRNLKEQLTSRGAGSAAEAVRAASERRPGLIISDISMPGTDGYALLAELRRMPGLEAVPAIALTGTRWTKTATARFAVHIPKPVDPDELLRVVRRLTA